MESDDESGISWEEEVPDFLIGNPEGISKWNDFLETKANLEKELLNDEEENLYLFQSGQITEEEYEVKHTTDRKGRLKTLEHEIGILEEQMREFEENITKVKQRRNIESLRPAREAADDAKLMKKFDNAAKKAAKFLDEIRPSDSKVRRGRAGLKYILAAPYGPIPGKNLNIQINHPIIDQPFYEAMTEEAEEEVERRARAKSVLENVDKSHLLNCIESFLESNKYYPDVRPKGGEIKLTFIQRLKIKNRYPILRIPKNVFVQLHLESEFEGEEKDFVESIVRTGKYLYVAPDNIDIDVTDGLNWERVNAKGIGSIVMKLSKAQGKTAKQRLRIAKKYYDRERREEKEEEGFQVPKPIPETKESRKFFDYVLPVSNRLFESLIKGSALSNTELTYCWARLERSEGGILYLRRFVDFKNYLANLLEAMDRNVKLTRNPTLIQGLQRKIEQIRYFLDNDQEMDPGTIETDQGPVEVSLTEEQMERKTEAADYLETNCGEVSEDLRNVLLNIIWTTFVTPKSFTEAIERVAFILNEYTDLVEKAERYVARGSSSVGADEINPTWLALMRGPIVRYSGDVRDWRPPRDLIDKYSREIDDIRQHRREIYERMENVMKSYTHYKKIEEQVELRSISMAELNSEIGNKFIAKMVKEQMMEHSIWESALGIHGITNRELKSKRANLPSQQSFTSPAERIETRRLLLAKLEKCGVVDTNSDLLENMLYNLTKTVKDAYKVARRSILSKKNEDRFCEISSAGISDESLNSLLAMISYPNNDSILEIDPIVKLKIGDTITIMDTTSPYYEEDHVVTRVDKARVYIRVGDSEVSFYKRRVRIANNDEPEELTYSEFVSLRSGYVTSLGNHTNSDDGPSASVLHDQRNMLLENEPPLNDVHKYADWQRALREVNAHIDAEAVGRRSRGPEIDTYIRDRINAIDNILKTMEVDVDLASAAVIVQNFYQKRRGGRRRRRIARATATAARRRARWS